MTPATGRAVARAEALDKVTGRAIYAAEYDLAHMAHAWPVQSTVARGAVRRVAVPEDLPGVLAVLWHANAPHLEPVEDAELAVLQSPRVSYRGQVVAVVVAETSEQAREAAARARVELDEGGVPEVVLRAEDPGLYAPDTVNPTFATDSVIGDVGAGLARAEVVVDCTYTTPPEHNNPMEPHATIAHWRADDHLVLYDSNQGPAAHAATIASLFGLETDQVEIVTEHVGGAFGSKGSPRPNAPLAAMAARVTGRPVRLVLTRQALFSMVGYRTPTIQRIQLGADAHGRLTAIAHDVVEQTSRVFEFAEQTALCTRHMYAAPERRTTHRLARLDVPTPRWMRAPGECPGMYALESAMDELAVACGLDPIELRARNEPEAEPETGTPFTSRHYIECLGQGAARFGWATRDPTPGARRVGQCLYGTGVAGAMYPVNIRPSCARAEAHPDGRFCVSIAAVDIGTGARTVLAQVAADRLGVPLGRVDLRLGHSLFPKASVAGGSSGTSSWGWAVSQACDLLCEELAARGGRVPPEGLAVTADTAEGVGEFDAEGKHAFGAHFAEVRVDAATGEVRVARLLSCFAAGRILSPRLARSQFIGAMTMGVGMALMEEGVLDERFGHFTNHDLAEYHVPTNADVEDIDAFWLDERDGELNPTASKGIGEIGIVGTAAAIANALFHATGVRVRDLPLRPDRVLEGLVAAAIDR